MKALILTASLFALPAAAFASPVVASLPSPNTVVSGTVESVQPDCACSPIVVLVDGSDRTLISADEGFLRMLGKQSGPVQVEGTLETYTNEETGAVKHVLVADHLVETKTAKK